MAMSVVRIGTRKSRLALWQANHVRRLLQRAHPGLKVELVEMITEGDRFLGAPLATVGGKGLFLKELEEGLLNSNIDLAVHSMKDVTVELPAGLLVIAICERASPFDALVCAEYQSFDELPEAATVGTTSLRRQCQLRSAYPSLRIESVRGNVDTRLQKLDEKRFDAMILGVAGLERLGLGARIRSVVHPDICVPAAGQGAIGIECRQDDTFTHQLVLPLNHPPSHICVSTERAANAALGGGCQAPIGIYAELDNDIVIVQGMVGRLDGREIIRRTVQGPAVDAEAIGALLADRLLSAGARQILQEIYTDV
ncbi:MAG: hydroxymethylbilane synthase [Gammaproteobacteria bacterium]|nr:hydroxymethylbilane synthase [Gammaproteobacteria bacterium]